MTTFSSLKDGDTISFETISPGILPHKFTQVRFEGLVSWTVARLIDDVASKHAAIYPMMNHQTVKDDYKSYSYLTFTNNGKLEVIGVPWTKEDTLTVSGSEDLTYVFPNMTLTNKTYLEQLLRANGFTSFYIA